MTDKELLEKAAKAAGVQGHFVERHPMDGYPTYSCGIGNAGRVNPLWNPLTDDGDALRLAVKLDMIDGRQWKAPITRAIYDECGGDWYAATRRAIVRAAATIAAE